MSALRRTDKVGPLGFVPNGNAQTNDLGEFRIAGLAAGDYMIVASVRRRGPFDAILTGAATTFAPTVLPRHARLEHGPGDDAHRVKPSPPSNSPSPRSPPFACQASRSIRPGRPSRRAMVTFFSDVSTSGTFMPLMSLAADDGTFTIGDVAPGDLPHQSERERKRRGRRNRCGIVWFCCSP